MKIKGNRQSTIDHRPFLNKVWRVLFCMSLVSIVYGQSSEVAFADDWLEGAGGYAEGRKQAIASHQPMVIYFYTDWCPYCRKFEKRILANPDVQKTLTAFVKIRINPEKGKSENALAAQYQAEGYPSVYFEDPASGQKAQEVMGATRTAKNFESMANEFAETVQTTILQTK